MNVKELIGELNKVDPSAEVILVVYTEDGYESEYAHRIDANCRYNSVTREKLKEDDKVIEITTSTKVKR